MFEKGIIVFATIFTGGMLAFILNWLALIPWRRSEFAHWAERARVLYPARVGSASNLWLISISVVILERLYFDGELVPIIILAPAAFIGTFFGSLFMVKKIYPRIPWGAIFRFSIIGWSMRFFVSSIFIMAAYMTPAEFDLLAILIGLAVIIFYQLWVRFGYFWLAKSLGVLKLPSQRLMKIASETAAQTGISFKHTYLMDMPFAQAFALLHTNSMMFTDRLMEICSDAEIAAVCAHELGHLSEPKSARFKRALKNIKAYPLIFLVPLYNLFEWQAVFGLWVYWIIATMATVVSAKNLRFALTG